MSDAGDNIPKYKMVDGQLVELSKEEQDEIMRERAARYAEEAADKTKPAPEEPKGAPHAHRRTK